MTAFLINVPDDHPLNKVILKHCKEFIRWSSEEQDVNQQVSMEDEFKLAKKTLNSPSKKGSSTSNKQTHKSVFDDIPPVTNEEIAVNIKKARKCEERLRLGKEKTTQGKYLEEGVIRYDPLNKADTAGVSKEIAI